MVGRVKFDRLAELLTVRLSAMGRVKYVVASNLRSSGKVLCGKQLVAFGLECVGHDYSVIRKNKGVSEKGNNQLNEDVTMWKCESS